ncbi:MAG: LysR substrate-binding domain-containing protein [Planctomycetota bacterium]
MILDDPLSIRQLAIFVALIEQGSFTRAARSLHLSQSTVSGHVADLERRLGVRLVERDRSGLRPTPAGEALLLPARDVLRAEKAARATVEDLTGLMRGHLVVGGSTIPAVYILPELFARFHQRHPPVTLRMRTGDSRDILDMVGRGEVELGVVGAKAEAGDLEAEPVGRDRLVLIVGSRHELAGKRRWSAEDLLAQPLVRREPGSGTREATDAALAGILGAKRAARLHVACEVGSTEAMKSAVRSGLGAAIISDLAVRHELEAGHLVAPDIAGLDAVREFYLVSRAEALLSPAARAFREVAIESD